MKKILLTLVAIVLGIIYSASFIQSHSLTPPAGMACNASGCHNGSGSFGSCTDSMIIVGRWSGLQYKGIGRPSSNIKILYDSSPSVVDTLTITLKLPQTPIAGFQFYVLDNNGNNEGNFIIVNSSNTIITASGGVSYMSHYNSTSGSNSWTFKWCPNSSNNVTFHYGIVCDTAMVGGGGGNNGGGSAGSGGSGGSGGGGSTGGGSCVPNCTGTSSGSFGGSVIGCSGFDPQLMLAFGNNQYSQTHFCIGNTVVATPYSSGQGSAIMYSYQFYGAGTLYSYNPTSGGSGNNVATMAGEVTGTISYSYLCGPATVYPVTPYTYITYVEYNPDPIYPLSNQTICKGQSVKIGTSSVLGIPYPLNQNYSLSSCSFTWNPNSTLVNPTDTSPLASPTTTTTYVINITSPLGCKARDSQIVYVKQPSTSLFSASFCNGDNYNFHGKTFSSFGNFNDTLTNYVGCDSIVTLHLIAIPTSSSSSVATICKNETYHFNGRNLTQAFTILENSVKLTTFFRCKLTTKSCC